MAVTEVSGGNFESVFLIFKRFLRKEKVKSMFVENTILNEKF